MPEICENGKISHLNLISQQYNFNIIHRSRRKHNNANTLSSILNNNIGTAIDWKRRATTVRQDELNLWTTEVMKLVRKWQKMELNLSGSKFQNLVQLLCLTWLNVIPYILVMVYCIVSGSAWMLQWSCTNWSCRRHKELMYSGNSIAAEQDNILVSREL